MNTMKVVLVLSLTFFAFVILHVTRAEAQVQPQQVFQVLHNGSLMSLEVLPDHHVVIRYAQPAPRLYGFVAPGMVLLEGHWDHQTLWATAYVFTRECGAFPYQVSGGVAPDGSLVLQGSAPYVVEGCVVWGYTWESSNSRLVFTRVGPPPPARDLGDAR
jgi:hypothetical protein